MSSAKIVEAVNQAIAAQHIDDRVIVAGQFNPRGSSAGMFAGGLAGDSLVGGALVSVAWPPSAVRWPGGGSPASCVTCRSGCWWASRRISSTGSRVGPATACRAGSSFAYREPTFR